MLSLLTATHVAAFTSWARATSIVRKAAFFLFPLAVLLASGAMMATAKRVHAATIIVTTTAEDRSGLAPRFHLPAVKKWKLTMAKRNARESIGGLGQCLRKY